MNRMKTILWVIMVMAICVLVPGCADEQRSDPKVFGQGNPPAEYVAMFGNDNGARLDHMQNQTINRLGNALANLSERVKLLEVPIAIDHSKCVLDEHGFCLTTGGCKVLNPDEVVK